MGQNFRRTKCFVGQNFRHQAEISTLLSDEFLSDKVPHENNPIAAMLKPIELYPNFFCFVGVITISSALCWVLPLEACLR